MVTSEVNYFIIDLPIYKKERGYEYICKLSVNFYTSTHSKLHKRFNYFN